MKRRMLGKISCLSFLTAVAIFIVLPVEISSITKTDIETSSTSNINKIPVNLSTSISTDVANSFVNTKFSAQAKAIATSASLESLSHNLGLYYPFLTVTSSDSLVADLATGEPVLDAKLQNGATVSSSNELLLSSNQNQYLSIGAFTIADSGITFTSWFRSSNSGSGARIFDFGNGQSSDNIYMGLFEPTNELSVVVFYNGNQNNRLDWVSNNVNTNEWHHAAWTISPTGDWIVYVDGSEVAQASGMVYPATIARASNFLGKSNWNSDAYLNGGIRDFRMYNRILSAAEIELLFTSTQVISLS